MELFDGLAGGFQIALTPQNLLFVFLGCLLGTLVGVLPGLGPIGAIALLLPATVHLPPVTAIIMLAGIYYGVMYGGSITSILMNIPGEAASVVTCIDGHQMAKQGRAGSALGISAIGSFVAGTAGLIALTVLAPPLSKLALIFGPAEYFAMLLCALSIVSFLASGPLWKAWLMATFGLVLGSVGIDEITGSARFTFGVPVLLDGINMVPVVMGFFGIGEILANLERREKNTVISTKIESLYPTKKEWADSAAPIGRGTVLGFVLGILPGGGAVLSSFLSYAAEKKISKTPERFGHGAIEGVAGPEAANNASTAGAFVPLLTLGIPTHALMALLMGALIVHGVQPGPLLMRDHPEVFWGTISSMYIGNVMLLILNLPLIPLWVRVLSIPYRYMFPTILVIVLVGAYSLNNSLSDVYITIVFAVIGYFARKLEFDAVPLLLALVLGPMLESSLRQALIVSGGSSSILLGNPIALSFLVLAILIPFVAYLPGIAKRAAKLRGMDGA